MPDAKTSEQTLSAMTETQLRAGIVKARAGLVIVASFEEGDYEYQGHPGYEMAPGKQFVASMEAFDGEMMRLYRLGLDMCQQELIRRGLRP